MKYLLVTDILTRRIKSILYGYPLVKRWVHPFAVRRYLRQWEAAGPSVKGKGKSYLIINHCYDQDIDALCASARERDETVWVLESSRVFKIANAYIPDRLTSRSAGLEHSDIAPYVEDYKRKFIEPLADRLMRVTKMHALITPSDIFFWLRPLIDTLHQRHIPTVVLDKEGSTVDSLRMDEHATYLKSEFKPLADLYIYWNERHRTFNLRTGIAFEKTRVIGQPRSDFFYHPDRWPTRASLGLTDQDRLIVFYTFERNAYLGRDVDDAQSPWGVLRRQVMEALRLIVAERDNAHLIVKAHPQQDDLWQTEKEFRSFMIPRSRFMIDAASSNRLTVLADVIVGFQSTVMIEAMLTQKPLLYTGWSPNHDELLNKLLPIPQSGGCDTPASAEDFRARVADYLDGRKTPSAEQLERRKAFTATYFGASKGYVSAEMWSAIETMINNIPVVA